VIAQLDRLKSDASPGWKRTTLGAIGEYINGRGFKKSEWGFAGLPIVRIQDLTGTGREQHYFDGEIDERHVINPGDLLISWAATLGAYIWNGPKAALNQHIFKVNSYINKSLHYYLIRHILDDLYRQTHGSGMVHITKDKFEATPIELPSSGHQQEQIVAEIEKQFSRLDAAVANLKSVKANLKRYKAAVLKAAVEGKLTEDWRKQHPNVEPASKLLERILAERRAKSKDKEKYIESVAPDIDNLPALPNGWIWTSLGQMFEVYVGATPSRGKQEYWDGTIPWVSSGEVAFCRIRKTKERITEKGLANSSAKLHPQGTVLLGMIGEGKTRGQVAILDIAACNNQNSAAIRVSGTGVPSEYVYRYLEGQYEENRLLGSGNNQPALNKARVQRIPLPLPSTNEQQQIVSEVERRLSVIEGLEAAVQANLTRADRLRQSILSQAFSARFVR